MECLPAILGNLFKKHEMCQTVALHKFAYNFLAYARHIAKKKDMLAYTTYIMLLWCAMSCPLERTSAYSGLDYHIWTRPT